MVTKFPGNGLFFTSDSHFGHSAILGLCERPFSTIEEHDLSLINNWNSIVGPDDTVFHLGDFCFGNTQKWREIREQLNGHIILIIGNHDWKQLTQGVSSLFDHVSPAMRITVDNRTVNLNHYPYLTFAHWKTEVYRDAYSVALSGHTHIRKNDTGFDAEFTKLYKNTQYDVGVDLNNYTPISWEEIDKRIKYQIENNTNVEHWINNE